MTHFFVCTPPGAVTRNATLPAGVQPECRNGSGAWIAFNSSVDQRIEAYLAANPPSPGVNAGECCSPEQLELLGVTPASVMASVAFGMSVVVAMWGIGYVGGLAVRAIREA